MNTAPEVERSAMLEELMRSRRSVRRFKPEPLGRELIERLVAAAVTAPSASNRQPWRFFATEDAATIRRLAAAVEEAVERIARHVPDDCAPAFRAYGDYFVRFRAAPAVIVVAFRELLTLSNLVDERISPGDRDCIREMEFNSGLASAALAVQNLMLYAHTIGLGTSCMTGPLVARERLKEILGIPETWRIAAVIPAGYPDEVPAPPARKPASAVLRWVGPEGNGTLGGSDG